MMKKTILFMLRALASFFAPLGEDYDMECIRSRAQMSEMDEYLLSFEEGLYA